METLNRMKRAAQAVLVSYTLLLAGCWDPVYGPAIRNGFDENVHVTVRTPDRQLLSIDLQPGQTFWQRTREAESSNLIFEVKSSSGTVVLDLSQLRALGLSRNTPVIRVSPSGVHAER